MSASLMLLSDDLAIKLGAAGSNVSFSSFSSSSSGDRSKNMLLYGAIYFSFLYIIDLGFVKLRTLVIYFGYIESMDIVLIGLMYCSISFNLKCWSSRWLARCSMPDRTFSMYVYQSMVGILHT